MPASTARLNWELGSNSTAAGAADRVTASGALSITSGTQLNVVLNGAGSTVALNDAAFWSQPRSWTILTAASVSGAFALGTVSTDPGGRSPANYGTFALQHSGTAVTLNFTPYPPLEVWKRVNFGADWNNPAIAGNQADPDNDSTNNLFEWAVGMDPTKNDTAPWTAGHAGLPVQAWVTVSDTNYLSLQVRRPIGLAGITYSGKVSGDLVNWTDAVQEGTPTSNGDGSEILILRDTVPKDQEGQRFIRLKITQP